MIERARVIAFESDTLKMVYSHQVCADCCYILCMNQEADGFAIMGTDKNTEPGVCEFCGKS